MTVVIGTAGHIDHGKTTLLRALTGIDADRLPEERRRGMTIDVGYAHLALPDGTELDFVDVPGHDRLIGNMLVGAGEIDAAMLVVAADDGPKAQTIEHLALLDALEIRDGLSVVTKIDVAGPQRTDDVVREVERLLRGTSLRDSSVVAASSVTGEGLAAVREALAAVRDSVLRRLETDGRPGAGSRLAIDRVFAVKGRGTVVTGTLRGDPLARSAALRLVPGDDAVRVREVQVHGRPVDTAERGRAALNLAGVEPADLHRGHALTNDDTVGASDRFLIRLPTPIPDRARVRVHLGTAATEGTIGRSGRDAIDLPDGGHAAILRLGGPIAVAPGDRLVLRRPMGSSSIVGATVLDVTPPRGISRRRQSAERVERLAAAIRSRDAAAIDAARLALHGAVVPTSGGGGRVRLADDVLDAAMRTVLEAIAGAAGAFSLTTARSSAARALRRQVTIGRTALASAASDVVDRLVSDGRLVRDGAHVRVPAVSGTGPSGDARDAAFDEAMDRLERNLAVPAPPPLAEAARAADCPATGIRELERDGRIVVLEPDLAYAASTYREIADRAVSMAATRALTPAALRDATGTSRKYVIAILADLDRRGVLRRTPDGHMPGSRTVATAVSVPVADRGR